MLDSISHGGNVEKRFSNIQHKKGEVEGYCIKWGKPRPVPQLSGGKEVFVKGSVRWPRTVALLSQHDQSKVLGTTKAKTLELSEDEVGLKFRCSIPKNDALTRELLERGDLSGASMGFHCVEDEYENGCRKIKKCNLSEISLVHDSVHDSPIVFRSAQKQKKKWTDLL